MSNDATMEEIDLTQFDDEFAATPEPAADDGKLPEGKYTARVSRAYFRNAKSSGRPMLSWELTVTGPAQVGRKLFRNNMLDRLEWVKKDLRTCGINVARLSELNLNDLLDVELEVQVKNNGDNQNVYLNKLIGGDGTTASATATKTVLDGAVPF
jgi:hypothetical protein